MTDAVHETMCWHWRRWSSSGHFLATRPSVSSRSWQRLAAGNGWHDWWLGSTARSSPSPTGRVPSTTSPRVEHRDDSEELVFGIPHDRFSRPYFEVLVVETMSPAQEERLREEVHSWRRPGDPFIYDLVIVGSGIEAAVAMRLNANIQACVIRRRFSHAARA